jgi:hypothetical protein
MCCGTIFCDNLQHNFQLHFGCQSILHLHECCYFDITFVEKRLAHPLQLTIELMNSICCHHQDNMSRWQCSMVQFHSSVITRLWGSMCGKYSQT